MQSKVEITSTSTAGNIRRTGTYLRQDVLQHLSIGNQGQFVNMATCDCLVCIVHLFFTKYLVEEIAALQSKTTEDISIVSNLTASQFTLLSTLVLCNAQERQSLHTCVQVLCEQKEWEGGGSAWYHPQGCMYMPAVVAGYQNSLVGAGCMVQFLPWLHKWALRMLV